MSRRLSYRGLKCPDCGYLLEGLAQPVCPECGSQFDPDWLYSVDYEYAIRWTPRRRVIAWALVAIPAGALIYGAVSVGPLYACMILVIIAWGVARFIARQL